jgi:uncharacterized MAPEG superfamily protein
MNPLTDNPALWTYFASAVVLGLNLLVLANNTALSRTKATEVVNPEDKRLSPKASIVYEGGNDLTSRYRRAHRNALENIPLFLVTGYLLTLTSIPFAALATLFGVFTVARVGHSVCYLKALQPWRTALFAIGGIAQLGILGYLGYVVATA